MAAELLGWPPNWKGFAPGVGVGVGPKMNPDDGGVTGCCPNAGIGGVVAWTVSSAMLSIIWSELTVGAGAEPNTKPVLGVVLPNTGCAGVTAAVAEVNGNVEPDEALLEAPNTTGGVVLPAAEVEDALKENGEVKAEGVV